jgi:hypothetical protein
VRFLAGLLLGLVATGVNFGILYMIVGWLVRGQGGIARYIAPLAQVGRYVIFGAIVYLALRYRLGSVGGLLTGVTVGITGFLVWQVVTNARNRRSG